jgi:hypothetical protein
MTTPGTGGLSTGPLLPDVCQAFSYHLYREFGPVVNAHFRTEIVTFDRMKKRAIGRYYDRLQPLLEGMNILFKEPEADNEGRGALSPYGQAERRLL